MFLSPIHTTKMYPLLFFATTIAILSNTIGIGGQFIQCSGTLMTSAHGGKGSQKANKVKKVV